MDHRDFQNYYALLLEIEQNRMAMEAQILEHRALKAQHDQGFQRFMRSLVGDSERG